MKFFKEFKEFALKGSILDMAIGIVIGGAFQSIITSLVEDIIMPFTALFTGSVDYSDWIINVSTAEIKIGSFITALISFFILALSVFLALKVIMAISKKAEQVNQEMANKIIKRLKINENGEEVVVAEPETKICPHCLTEIKYRATRCPNCTSELDSIDEIKE